MLDPIVTATGRWLVWLAYIFPLSTRFLDERFRDNETQHISWGSTFYVGLFAGAACFVGWLLQLRP